MAGQQFAGIQAPMQERGGMREHDTTYQRPLRLFKKYEQAALLPLPAGGLNPLAAGWYRCGAERYRVPARHRLRCRGASPGRRGLRLGFGDAARGTGEEAVAEGLSAGMHTITLSATDSDGHVVEQKVRLWVGSQVYLAVILRQRHGPGGN
jgi:hypothetical protein